MRRANGTGTVVKLSGNRRKPYVVKIPARDKYGRVVQKPLSYHEKAQEAHAALDEYNAKQKAGVAIPADKLDLTVQDIYDMWSTRKYAKSGDASVASNKASWNKRVSSLSHLKMREVTIDHLQQIIDKGETDGLSQSVLNNDKILMKALFEFAMKRDIIVKDYSAFIDLPAVGTKHKKGAIPDIQMKQLEDMAAKGIPWADAVLMLCYTGFRISEFLALTRFSYDPKENTLRGGMKTEAGKDRIIPVHPKIKPYLLNRLSMGGERIICDDKGAPITSSHFRTHEFASVFALLNMPEVTPHWCRHTFASMLHAAGVPNLEAKRLLGHANKDITEHYTHTDIEQLRKAILMLA